MANDYLPGNDLAFQDWYTNFVTYLAANAARLGITEDEVLALQGVQTAFGTALTTYHGLRDQAKAAGTDKEAKRGASTTVVRPIVARVQAGANTTDIDRDRLRIPIRGQAVLPTGGEQTYDRPAAIIDISQRLRHVIRVHNENNVSPSKARPAGMVGYEIRRKIGEPPAGPLDTELVDVVSKSPVTLDYPDSDAGKTVHYLFRWVSRSGEKGNWSETESATIAEHEFHPREHPIDAQEI